MDGVVGEIRYFGFPFAPRNYLVCDGRELIIQQNQALFSLLGIRFGGDAKTTFKIPDLRGRAILCSSDLERGVYPTGFMAGQETVTLKLENIPPHTHGVKITSAPGTTGVGNGNHFASVHQYKTFGTVPIYSKNTSSLSEVHVDTVVKTGETSHPNMQPFAVVGYCICQYGFYPSRD